MKKKGDEFENIISDIKSIKIQGATDIALSGIQAYLLKPNKKSAKIITSTRPTEPLLQNVIKMLRKSSDYETCAKDLIKEIKTSKRKIAKEGNKLIKNGMKIFTHCHSSSVIEILKEAKKQKKRFHVFTVEVEPLLQGRMTAKELAKSKIKTTIGPDLAAEQLLKNCDLFLFGADAFTNKKIVNKIGTQTLCKLAKIYKIPRYSCGAGMKYAKRVKLETRSGREVWKDNKKEISVVYPAFDKTNMKLVSGIVSEFGILKTQDFLKRAKKKLFFN
jgi:translation initiation factor 2B subunit (eIF-2B alpha/beta/delta family)